MTDTAIRAHRREERTMTDLSTAEQEWHDWIAVACERLGVDADSVDVVGIHALTKDIAHDFARPMAPVGSYILGLAVGARSARGEPVRAQELADALRATLGEACH